MKRELFGRVNLTLLVVLALIGIVRFANAETMMEGNPSDVKFYSAKDPSFYQISRQEQALDVLRNVTTTPRDRVKEFSFKASGDSYAKLFDGTEKVLSWDNILWINRSVLLP